MINRALSVPELFFYFINKYEGNNHFHASAILRGEVSKEKLRYGLDKLQNSQPLLQCHIVKSSFGKIRIKGGIWGPIILEEHEYNGKNWEPIMVENYNHHFNEKKGSLVKCLFFKNITGNVHIISLLYFHPLFDGISGMNALLDLLKYSCSLTGNIGCKQPLPPIEKLYPSRYKGIRGIIHTFGYQLRLFKNHKDTPVSIEGYEVKKNDLSDTCIHNITVEGDDLIKIYNHCKKNRVSVNSALSAIQLMVFYKAYIYPKKQKAALLLPYNLRKNTLKTVPADYLGLFFSILTFQFKIDSETAFWDLARNIQDELEKQKKEGNPFVFWKSIGFIRMLPANRPTIRKVMKTIGNLSPVSTSISNLGKFNSVYLGKETAIEGLRLGHAPLMKNPFCTHIVTYNNSMHIELTFNGARVDKKKKNNIIGWYKNLLGEKLLLQ